MFTSKAVNMLAVAVFSGAAAVAGIMLPASAEQSTTIVDKTVVMRDSWTGSYTVDAKSYDNMIYTATVYSDGSVTIKGQHNYNWTSYYDTFSLGTLWYDDGIYGEIEDTFTTQSKYLTILTNYGSQSIGYSFSLYNDSNKLLSGTLFEFSLIPKKTFQETTIDVFGNKITVSPGTSQTSEQTTENQSDRVKELELQIAKLQEELEAAKAAIPAGSGDVNGDGQVNSKDAVLILKYAAYRGTGGSLTIDEWISENANNNNVIASEVPSEEADIGVNPDNPAMNMAGAGDVPEENDYSPIEGRSLPTIAKIRMY
ncbi:MAG: dockerin type I repeat-containing protein [Oscillospiraceae bacterium]|nr:dockerin type I repeat-containing protein [Oscillospiraceae bacterium]